MVVKGIIKTIDFADNSCKVRLPIFETAASQGEVVLEATILIQPGMYNGYAEGDVVYVDFENDKLSQPVVIGKLYLGAGKESEIPPHAALAVSNLNVTKSATLPIDTKLVIEDLGDTVPVENGVTSYKSLTDIIKALYKTETDVGQVTHDQAEMVSKIQVEYLSQPVGDGVPGSDNQDWQPSIPEYQDGYAIWQKTTCYNYRGQILNVEIICLTSVSSSAVYRLRCSTRMHMGTNHLESVHITAMVKIGTDLEIEDRSATLYYSWSDREGSTTPVAAPLQNDARSQLTLKPEQLQPKNLIITAKHGETVYDSETIIYSPLNTPFILLSNESDSLVYEADGTTVLSEPVTSTATLYLNGDVLPATYSWELTNCSSKSVEEDPDGNLEDTTIVTGNTVTVKQVSPRTRYGVATCKATVTQDGAFKRKTYSKDFTISQTRVGENATSFWLASSCTVHTGLKHGQNITVTAMKKTGIQSEEPDTKAFIWWKYKNVVDNPATSDKDESAWRLAAANYRVNFVFPTEIIDDDILLLATHNAAFNPNEEGIDLLTDINIYEQEEIPFSPLNTPTLNLTNDTGAFSCKSDGTKINEADTTSTEAELMLNGSKLVSGVTYSWNLIDCATPTGATGTEAVTTAALTIKTLSANVAYAICTATYKGESYSKTFKVVKQIQGQSLYTIDIFNDFVTIPTDEHGNISDDTKADLPAISAHHIACHYGGEDILISSYSAATPTIEDDLFRIKYTLSNVTLYNNAAVVAPNFAIADLTADEGSIIYELYRGTTKLASAKFEATKLHQGPSAVTYWLNLSARVHIGTNQKTAITATAMQKIGTLGVEDIDEAAELYYKYDGEYEWIPATSPKYSLTITPNVDKDLIIKAIHKDGADEVVYETETLTFSPLNTPVLDLDNDSDAILYSADGTQLLGSPVESEATLYLNGDPLEATYDWQILNGRAVVNDATSTSVTGKTVTVAELLGDTARAVCTAKVTVDGPFKDKTYTKVFTVSKTKKGDNAIGYSLVMDQRSFVIDPNNTQVTAVSLSGTCYIHDGNSVQPFGNASYKYKVDNTGSYTTGTADSDGTFTFTVSEVTTQVEVCLVVDNLVVDREIIKTIPSGVSIVSQDVYYALVHNSYTAGSLKAPAGDSDLAVKQTNGIALLRLDQASTTAQINAARTWGLWSRVPPAHTENTNGWKYWTTIRTEYSSSTAGHYSTPIINEDLSGIYALAEGKTTNYYSDTDPSENYTIKEGDCWFHTDETIYEYTPSETIPTVSTGYIGYYVTPDDNNPTVYIEVTADTIQDLLDGKDLMTLIPGHNKIYTRAAIGTGGALYQWVGSTTSGYWKDIGEEIVANKVTANFINALKITAKKVKILDTDNTTLFEADGLDGAHKVQIGGFEVIGSTLTTGSTANNNLITLSGNTDLAANAERLTIGDNFKVLADGTVYATNLYLLPEGSEEGDGETAAGKLAAISAELNHIEVKDADNKIIFKADGRGEPQTRGVEIGGFEVTSTSILSGEKQAALAADPTLTLSEIAKDYSGVYIGPEGLSIGKGFTVYSGDDGKATVANVELTAEQTAAFTPTVYWISSTCSAHTGTKHGTSIVVTAMMKVGDKTEDQDTSAHLWWKYENTGATWAKAAAQYRINFTFPDEVPDDDILIIATHDSGFNPNADGVNLATDSRIYRREEIPYSPVNSPILNLTSDSGALTYDGNTKIGTDTVSTTAELWLNGSKITSGVTYSWTLTGCKNNSDSTSSTGATVIIKSINNNINTASATCTATYDGSTYTKTFTITKQLKGEQGASGVGTVGPAGRSVVSTTTYYALAKTAPTKPADTVQTPAANSDWKLSPPTYENAADGSTQNYYQTIRTSYSDGTQSWSDPVQQTLLDTDFINALGVTAKKISVTGTQKTVTVTDVSQQFNLLQVTNVDSTGGLTINKGFATSHSNIKTTGSTTVNVGGSYTCNNNYEIALPVASDAQKTSWAASYTLNKTPTYAILKITFKASVSGNVNLITKTSTAKGNLAYATSLNSSTFSVFYDGILPDPLNDSSILTATKTTTSGYARYQISNPNKGDYLYIIFINNTAAWQSSNLYIDTNTSTNYTLFEADALTRQPTTDGSTIIAGTGVVKIGNFTVTDDSITSITNTPEGETYGVAISSTNGIDASIENKPVLQVGSGFKAAADGTFAARKGILSEGQIYSGTLGLGASASTADTWHIIDNNIKSDHITLNPGEIAFGETGKLFAEETGLWMLGPGTNGLLFTEGEVDTTTGLTLLKPGGANAGTVRNTARLLFDVYHNAKDDDGNWLLKIRYQWKSEKANSSGVYEPQDLLAGLSFDEMKALKTPIAISTVLYAHGRKKSGWFSTDNITQSIPISVPLGMTCGNWGTPHDVGGWYEISLIKDLSAYYGLLPAYNCVVDRSNNEQDIKQESSPVSDQIAVAPISKVLNTTGIIVSLGGILPGYKQSGAIGTPEFPWRTGYFDTLYVRDLKSGTDYQKFKDKGGYFDPQAEDAGGTGSSGSTSSGGSNSGYSPKPSGGNQMPGGNGVGGSSSSSSGGGSGRCFDAGTQVLMADGTSKNIEEIQVGDLIWSYNVSTKQPEVSEVLSLHVSNSYKQLVHLTFEDGTVLDTTMTHPFYTTSGWVSLDPSYDYNFHEDISEAYFEMMTVGQTFYKANYNTNQIDFVKLSRIQYRHGVSKDHLVYNLNVSNNNTFFANGILGHNIGIKDVVADLFDPTGAFTDRWGV